MGDLNEVEDGRAWGKQGLILLSVAVIWGKVTCNFALQFKWHSEEKSEQKFKARTCKL